MVVHGHAPAGTERGVTAGGVRVRNVALPVLMHTYPVYCFDGAGAADCGPVDQRGNDASATGPGG